MRIRRYQNRLTYAQCCAIYFWPIAKFDGIKMVCLAQQNLNLNRKSELNEKCVCVRACQQRKPQEKRALSSDPWFECELCVYIRTIWVRT